MNNKQVENLIYQYHWRSKEVDWLTSILFGRYSPVPSFGLVQQLGIEARKPKKNVCIIDI
ncbi:hypothetical protein [Aquibacillus kalidii]|uniref:hypothetical protein n=1 Tax=Aquibacillus kalidii TaxID=2762597 RepID=UPI001647900A|nr:hypothetical protein [Aquibacillus kalidii]